MFQTTGFAPFAFAELAPWRIVSGRFVLFGFHGLSRRRGNVGEKGPDTAVRFLERDDRALEVRTGRGLLFDLHNDLFGAWFANQRQGAADTIGGILLEVNRILSGVEYRLA